MDSYRGNLVQREPTVTGSSGDEDGARSRGSSDDDIGREPPPAGVGQPERRMQVRAYNFWAGLLGDRPFPPITELTGAGVPDFADHAVVLDFSQGIANPAVTMLGEKLAQECGAATSITQLSDVPGQSLLSRITDHYRQILASAAPIGFEAEFVNQRGKTLLYRGILLPFSSGGDKIEQVMGVINWKELADPLVIAGLRHELEVAGGPAHSALSSSQLHTWADGPIAAETVAPDMATPDDWPVLTETLRQLPGRSLRDVSTQGGEFSVLLIRRLPGGRLCWLGEVDDVSVMVHTVGRLLVGSSQQSTR